MEQRLDHRPARQAGAPTRDAAYYQQNERLSLPFELRLAIGLIGGFVIGSSLGVAHHGKMAALRFRAEHAHVLPTTTAGWYFYHKSKNYNVMFHGIKGGFKMGSKIAGGVGGFLLVEEAIDRLRGSKDLLSTVIAGLATAGGFSAWKQFPMPTAARTARLGLRAGLVYGVAQDALGILRGREPGYVKFFRRPAKEREI